MVKIVRREIAIDAVRVGSLLMHRDKYYIVISRALFSDKNPDHEELKLRFASLDDGSIKDVKVRRSHVYILDSTTDFVLS